VLVHGFALANLNRPRCTVALPLVNNAFGIGHNGVVDKNVEMIFGPEQRTNIATEHKVWSVGTFDGLSNVCVGGMHKVPHLVANVLLPIRERMNVFVDARVGLVCTHGSMISQMQLLLPYFKSRQ